MVCPAIFGADAQQGLAVIDLEAGYMLGDVEKWVILGECFRSVGKCITGLDCAGDVDVDLSA